MTHCGEDDCQICLVRAYERLVCCQSLEFSPALQRTLSFESKCKHNDRLRKMMVQYEKAVEKYDFCLIVPKIISL